MARIVLNVVHAAIEYGHLITLAILLCFFYFLAKSDSNEIISTDNIVAVVTGGIGLIAIIGIVLCLIFLKKRVKYKYI